jgi:acetoin utilization protein AcuB
VPAQAKEDPVRAAWPAAEVGERVQGVRMLVEQSMSRKVVTAKPESTIAEAREVMTTHGIRHLPVVQGKRVVGIVSDRDLLVPREGVATVGDAMTRDPRTVLPESAVDECAQLMRQHRIDALPVVEEGRLVGILTSSDILDAFVELTGVAGPSFLMLMNTPDALNAETRVQEIVTQRRGQIKWLHCDRDRTPVRIQLRLAGRRVEDIATALEAAGFDVTGLVAGPGIRREPQ